jgi:hypothetical protein
MKNRYLLFAFLTIQCLSLFAGLQLTAQCLSYPVPIQQRANEAATIVKGKVVEKTCYQDADGNIYTLNLIDVQAYLKGNSDQTQVGVITIGGILGNQAMLSFPAVQLNLSDEYILFLEKDNTGIDNKSVRSSRPDLVQSLTYSDAQGALIYQFGKYADIHFQTKDDELIMLQRISELTGEIARTPSGKVYKPNTYIPAPELRNQPITSFSPSPSNAGTIVPADFLTISGSGFGAGAGTVFYTNADDGGATFTASAVASDNVSWSDGSIVNKIARRAGTGPINVNGAATSGANLTVNYAHLDINSSFSGFGSSTRQRYYLVNKNNLGGYTFQYNTTSGFDADIPATEAFERAMTTWTCSSFVNWRIGANTTAAYALDGINAVTYDNSLPMGTAMRMTSRFNGSASGGCNLANTVWWVDEMDLQAVTIPSPGFPWEYGPALPSFTEYDMETFFLHELGHGHGLGHVINIGDVMHFAFANGISLRTLIANNLTAANAKMTYSTAPTCLNPATVTGPMIALNSGNCNTLLPLELLYFDGQLVKDKVELEWMTAFEQNVDKFEVERSADAVHFNPIASVSAKGNSSENTHYNFDDNEPLTGISYYRLKSIDRDASFTYSDIITIRNETVVPPFQISPNPAVNTIQVTVESAGKYILINESGLIVKEVQLAAGNQEIAPGILPSGTYYLVDPVTYFQVKVVLIREN